MSFYHWSYSTRERAEPSGTFGLALGNIYFVPFRVFDRPLRVTRTGVNVSTAQFFAFGGMAIYTRDSRTHKPKRLLANTATNAIDLGATGLRFADNKMILQEGEYFIAFGSNATTAVLSAYSDATLRIPDTTPYTTLGTFWRRAANVWSGAYEWPQDAADIGALTLQSIKNPPALMLETDGLEGA